VYGFPQSNGCGWAGLGTVGGNPSAAWTNGTFNLLVVGHEMGHNFGLYHAHSLICPGVTLGTNCSTGEYGDPFEIMGNYTASQPVPGQWHSRRGHYRSADAGCLHRWSVRRELSALAAVAGADPRRPAISASAARARSQK
jgi:hypothetical protein